MAVRSTPVALVESVPHATATVIYTVPAGRTLVLHALVAVNRSTGARRVLVNVRRGAAAVSIGRSPDLATDGTFVLPQVPVVLAPGDHLEVFHTGANTSVLVSFFASGSLLLGAPE